VLEDPLAAAIARRFPDAVCTPEFDGVRIELTHEGVTYKARAEQAPVGRVSVQLPSTDGFELALSWTDRNVGSLGASFDDSCLVQTNDVSLARVWLDREAQAALIASRYTQGRPDPMRNTAPLMRDGAWHHELRADQVVAQRTEPEPSPDRISDLLATSLALATRPARWAHWFRPLAKSLGGEALARVELGGRPVLRVRRGQADVTVRLLRRLGPGDPGRLRTVVGAHRIGSGGETLTLISEDLPRSAWPPLGEESPHKLAIDPHAQRLLGAARPSTTLVRKHDIEITFDGVFGDHDRLGAAVELAAYWAAGHKQTSPYR
jgi:hypothetical protein